MKSAGILCAIVLCVASALSGEKDSKKVFLCYWGSWSYYRDAPGKFTVANIDPTLCTHLIYAFAKLKDGQIAPFDAYLDTSDKYGLGTYKKFNDLKTRNPHLKTLISIGGQTESSVKYSDMAATLEGRRQFIDSVLKFLSKYGFDGLDLSWDFPTLMGGRPEDRANYVQLISELRAEFDPRQYTLTAAVSPNEAVVNEAYDVPQLSKYLDFISVMCYDYFGPWNGYAAHNSPLRSRDGGSQTEKRFNVEYSINYWIRQGVDPSKLVLGMPLFGRTFTLADPSVSDFGAPTIGPGPMGPILKESGVLGYNEVCKSLREPGWTIRRERNVVAPVAVRGTEWVGYDDTLSLTVKAGFARTMGLAGAMVWAIEMDDFHGFCSGEKNPLQTAIKTALESPTDVLPQRQESTTESCLESSTNGIPQSTKRSALPCPSDGFFAYPGDPHRFYRCVETGDHYEIYVFDCAAGAVFDEALTTCTFA